MRFAKPLAFLAVICWMASMAPMAEAARKKHAVTAGAQTVTGTVLHHHGKKPVAGALVHFAATHRAKHHRHSVIATSAGPTKSSKPKAKPGSKTLAAKRAARVALVKAKIHRAAAPAASALSDANGHFSLTAAHGASHLVVAHKKHVGIGHARVTLAAGQTAAVRIRLHKHHHHHSTAVAVAQNGELPKKA